MTNTVEQLSTLIKKSWQQGKYPQVIRQLSKIPKETVLEALVCIADEVTPQQRLGLLEKLDEELVGDGAVLTLFGL